MTTINENEQAHKMHELKQKLKAMASQRCWLDGDEDDFNVEDFAGGNLDDAFSGGERVGEVMAARDLWEFLYGDEPWE